MIRIYSDILDYYRELLFLFVCYYYDLELILLELQADFSSIMYDIVIIVSAFFTEISSTVVFQSAMFEQSSFIIVCIACSSA